MIEFTLDASSVRPLERQIVDQVRSAIEGGHLLVGEPLPTVAWLASRLGVDVDTLSRAYREMESHKLVESQPGPDQSRVWYVAKGKTSLFKEQVILSRLARLCGNSVAQRFLTKVTDVCQYLMGIGSGGYVFTSGEGAALQVLGRACRPPYVIFDAGAYRGWFARLVLETFGQQELQVHCFEPCATTFRLLEESMRGEGRVRLNHLGLSKERGQASLYYDAPGSGRASLTKLNLEHSHIVFKDSECVQLETVDAYCAANSVDRIHLLKMDVEGHELEVLNGASRMLERDAVDMVTFEFGKCDVDTRSFFKDFFYFFRRVDMRLFRITPSGYLAGIQTYSEIHEQFRTTNFLAVKSRHLPNI